MHVTQDQSVLVEMVGRFSGSIPMGGFIAPEIGGGNSHVACSKAPQPGVCPSVGGRGAGVTTCSGRRFS